MDWGLSARSALLCCIVNISDVFTSKLQWQWLSQQLSDMNCMSESSDILTQQFIILGQAKVNCVLGNVIHLFVLSKIILKKNDFYLLKIFRRYPTLIN